MIFRYGIMIKAYYLTAAHAASRAGKKVGSWKELPRKKSGFRENFWACRHVA